MKFNVKRHAVTQPLDPSVRLIPLTQGQNAIVDAVDYDWLMQWNWHADWAKSTKSFYAFRNEGKEPNRYRVGMHRIVLGLGHEDKREPDHVNHDSLDNRRNNLRIATRSQNVRNSGKRTNNTSGFKGVWRNGSGWMAEIGTHGKQIYLGTFSTPEEAHDAYGEAAKKLHGEFMKLD